MNIADETLTDYSFLSRYHHYTKSKNYLKRRYRIRHIRSLGHPVFIILKFNFKLSRIYIEVSFSVGISVNTRRFKFNKSEIKIKYKKYRK